MEIRGLPEHVEWMSEIVQCFKANPRSPISYGAKEHMLHQAEIKDKRLRLIFISYALGDRPDVINTSNMQVEPSPLKKSQAIVTYTHAIAYQGSEEPRVLLEIVNTGIGAGACCVCLGNLLTDCLQKNDPENKSRVRVYMKPITGEEDFFERLKKSDRVVSFTIRFPRHENPGISSAINNLSAKMNESNVGSAEVTSRPIAGETLPTDKGIIPHGKNLKAQNEVEYFRAETVTNNRTDKLRSNKMDEKYVVKAEVIDNRRVNSNDMFGQLSRIVEEVFF
jgi:hypothetical protein